MKFKWSCVLLFPVLCVPFGIYANDEPHILVSANQKSHAPKIRSARLYRYGMAGCGLGSLFFDTPEEQNQRFYQVIASMTDEAPFYAMDIYASFVPLAPAVLVTYYQLGILSTFAQSSIQASAYSAGTCNCTDDPPHRAARDQEIYIAINKRQLEKETAQAAGPHLTALAKVLGCEDQVLQEFGAITQKAYGQIFEKDEPKIITEKYRFLVLNSEPLSSSCYKDL